LLILGASSGIGKATALLFAQNGYRLSLSGRNEIALNKVVEECVTNYGLAKDQVRAFF
jgi:short-subunit dehydrogenase